MITLLATLGSGALAFGTQVYQTPASIRAPDFKKYCYFKELLRSLERERARLVKR